MSTVLDDYEIGERLKALPGWVYTEGKLHTEFQFSDFKEAFAFMTACAQEAEKLNHHPDWSNSWAMVKIDLTTHDVEGVTELDFKLAEKMEALAGRC